MTCACRHFVLYNSWITAVNNNYNVYKLKYYMYTIEILMHVYTLVLV